MEIFNDYTSVIKKAIKADRISRNFSGIDGLDSLQKGLRFDDLVNEVKTETLLPSLAKLAEELGVKIDYTSKLGQHPDYRHLLGTDKKEYGSIVSMFIDITASTILHDHYTLETVHIISKAIQKLAIDSCLVFDGYVQRIQGDGVFLYFGGKKKDDKESIKNSVRAASLFTYFVQNDLKELFEEENIKQIRTRVGVDYGDDSKVLWASDGVGQTSEVSTSSLHTNLASKMESNAGENGIVVGDNIRKAIGSDNLTLVSSRTGDSKDKYIHQKSFYEQYDLDWGAYLKSQVFIATSLNGVLSLRESNNVNYVQKDILPIAQQNTPYLSV